MLRFAPLVVLVATPVATADPTLTEAEAELIALVEQLGGTARVNDSLDEQARVEAVFEKPTDEILLRMSKRPSLGSLDLRSLATISEKGLATLRELPDLQHLYLSDGTLTPAEAAAVGRLRPLTLLAFAGCKLGDTEVAKFADLKFLTALDLLDTAVSDKAVDALLALTALEQLNLSGTRVTDAGAKKLLKLEGLRLLQLNNTRVTATAIEAMEEELKGAERGLKILR